MKAPRALALPGRLAGLTVAVAAVALLLLSSCDESFEPIAPSEQRLALWGYLDASADTQWIRVSIMRPTLLTSPDTIPVQVTVQNLADGRTIELRQQITKFIGTAAVDSAGTSEHNFWTVERIQPGASYRLRAQPAAGQTAEVVVRVPADYDVNVDLAQSRTPGTDSLRLPGLQFAAFVTATSYYYDTCGSTSEVVSQRILPGDTMGTTRSISIGKSIAARASGCGSPWVTKRMLWLAGSGAPWPFGQSWSATNLGPGPTNITNGTGFVGGVTTKAVPYENCTYSTQSTAYPYCRLHYDLNTPTLTGTVSDTACGFHVRRVTVTLRELDPVAPEPAKIRSTVTDADGGFWISGLVPNMRYGLTLHRDERPPGGQTEEYYDQTTTLVFGPAANVRHDATLQRGIFPCPTN